MWDATPEITRAVTPRPQAFQPALTGARFPSAQDALAFLGAVAGAELAGEASARRGPGGDWWIEAPVDWSRGSSLVYSAGGAPFAGSGSLWAAVPGDGSGPAPPTALETAGAGDRLLYGHDRDEPERLAAEDWPEANLVDLLLSNRPRPAHAWKLERVFVMAPGVLARAVLNQAVGLRFSVSVSAAECFPLTGRSGERSGDTAPPTSVGWLRIAWPKKKTPETFLRSLLRLPFVLVAHPLEAVPSDDASGAKLLADIRYATPLADALVSSLISPLVKDNERWLLGGPEIGHWRVQVHGKPRDAGTFIQAPASPMATPGMPATAFPTGNQSAAIPLRLMPRSPGPGHPDAVLVDDTELGWLRDYLMGKPAAETAYLAPGPGRHLLLAPGGLLTTLPFGIPLRRIGVGGLYLQEGRALHPPLPETARGRVFPCDAEEIVAVTNRDSTGEIAATRFDLDTLVPVWTLWLGGAPPVEEGVSAEIAAKIRKLAADLQPPEQPRWRKQAAELIPALRPRPVTDRGQLLRQSMQLERAGRLAEAVQCLEQAGELAAAGRLYERAAVAIHEG
ncbi:MAG: hypothetical protein BECKG1743D_GA0114223_108061 [Candidatus Kentron sp. G]|nr:MAG: hypothetical protein BECKG1743F_GA0114225_107641 [Candidatus Kentron sp. G]VFN04686.1 MAG: hypothetical protein BECKG1743E_GA0114224_107621 [Candidatus Kentron sp. G]VFN06056.1 MAG: hypothetical protein BECKG1743D_GA0114223_108061 [Candidatus Kentron sp. G]